MQITLWASTGINAEKVKEIYKEGLILKYFSFVVRVVQSLSCV